MKNIQYILIGLLAGYLLFKKKKRYSITTSIETITKDQFLNPTKKVGEFPEQF